MCNWKRVKGFFGNGRITEEDMKGVKKAPRGCFDAFLGDNFLDLPQRWKDRRDYETQEIEALREEAQP